MKGLNETEKIQKENSHMLIQGKPSMLAFSPTSANTSYLCFKITVVDIRTTRVRHGARD
jgi:hypothetical protein